MDQARTSTDGIANGDYCLVERGTHSGKTGQVRDRKSSKTGHMTVTVEQANGERFKTLARNVSRRP